MHWSLPLYITGHLIDQHHRLAHHKPLIILAKGGGKILASDTISPKKNFELSFDLGKIKRVDLYCKFPNGSLLLLRSLTKFDHDRLAVNLIID